MSKCLTNVPYCPLVARLFSSIKRKGNVVLLPLKPTVLLAENSQQGLKKERERKQVSSTISETLDYEM